MQVHKPLTPPGEMSHFYNRAHPIQKLEQVGLQSMHVYDKGHCHFYNGDEKQSRLHWYRNAAAIEMDLHQHLHRTRHGNLPLCYFDGSIMMNYQMPPKVVETTYCQEEETPLEYYEYLGLDELRNKDSVFQLKDRQSFPGDYQVGQGQVSDFILKFVTQYF